jgi:hypothetical protein
MLIWRFVNLRAAFFALVITFCLMITDSFDFRSASRRGWYEGCNKSLIDKGALTTLLHHIDLERTAIWAICFAGFGMKDSAGSTKACWRWCRVRGPRALLYCLSPASGGVFTAVVSFGGDEFLSAGIWSEEEWLALCFWGDRDTVIALELPFLWLSS